jgi:SAM-dependent methyltransferase
MRDRLAVHYGAAAPEYLRYWAPVLVQCSAPLVRKLPERPASVLDLGCGTGALMPALEDLLAENGIIVGGDLTPEMLAAALSTSRGSFEPVRMDAARLPFRDQSFDLIVCTFVLHHVREQHRALAEAYRTLRSGGTLGVSLWDAKDPGGPAFDLFEELLGEFGAPSSDPSPLPVWEDAIGSPEGLVAIFQGLGYDPVHAWRETAIIRWTAANFLGYRFGQGGSRRRLEALPPARRIEFREVARRRFERLTAADLVWRPSVIHAIAGRRDA